MKLNYLMLSEHELKLLRRRARRGWALFCIGCSMALAGTFQVGRHIGFQEALPRVEAVEARQELLVKELEKAWGSQQSATRLIIGAAQRIKERDELVTYNQMNSCPRLPVASRKVGTE